jgi:uncharacterized protein YjbI with pentapeptide repeats
VVRFSLLPANQPATHPPSPPPQEAVLTKAYAFNANLSGADLTNAVVDRVDFNGANLTGAQFVNAVVTGASFEGARGDGGGVGRSFEAPSTSGAALLLSAHPPNPTQPSHTHIRPPPGSNLADTNFEDALIGSQDAAKLCANPTLTGESRAQVGCRVT